MNSTELKNKKKITKATLKKFIREASELYVKELSSFDGMVDMVRTKENPRIVKIAKEDAIGINGVYCVGRSGYYRDYFEYYEDDEYFGIEVYNSCGNGLLLTKQSNLKNNLKLVK